MRAYHTTQRKSVQTFYRLNHEYQTYDFAAAKRKHYGQLNRIQMDVWQACEKLHSVIDDSDPDTELTQIEHLLQTAEAIRADGRPDWFVLTGLVHDLGKLLCVFGEPQ